MGKVGLLAYGSQGMMISEMVMHAGGTRGATHTFTCTRRGFQQIALRFEKTVHKACLQITCVI